MKEHAPIRAEAAHGGQEGKIMSSHRRDTNGPPRDHGPTALEFARLVDSVRRLGRELRMLHESDMARLIGRLVAALENGMCRIAVIGQVKAGKTSFVNALTRKPQLLPTEVNPWTAVVTRIHFDRPSGPVKGAAFEFFSEEEWRRLSDHGGRLGEVAARLLSDFKIELLRDQLEQLRARAKARLGASYQQLLGQKHQFETLTSEILSRYIAAGDAVEDADPGSRVGRFSDITRGADIYFEGSPLGLPMTVIDTPGTNDPFLVRDELTLQSLDNLDACVVVLTARQALTTPDLMLLRMIQGLHKDRIIAFINRVDDLENPAMEARAVVHRVQRLLDEEVQPGIPIIVGSAKWANLGLLEAGKPAATPADPNLARYALSLGLVDAGEATQWSRGAIDPARASALLLACSGEPSLLAELDKVILGGPYARIVVDCARTLQAVAETREKTARTALVTLEQIAASAGKDPAARAAEVKRVERDLAETGASGETVKRIHAAASQGASKLVAGGQESLRGLVRRAMNNFVAEQKKALRDALRRKGGTASWRCDASDIRRQIEEEVLQIHGQLRLDLARVRHEAVTALRSLLPRAASPDGAQAGREEAVETSSSPSLGFLSMPIAFDLDRTWWKRWFMARVSVEDTLREFEKLLSGELDMLLETMLASSRKTAEAEASGMLDLVSMIGMAIDDEIAGRRERLSRAARMLASPEQPRDGAAAGGPTNADLAEAAAILQRCSEVSAAFRGVVARIRAELGPAISAG